MKTSELKNYLGQLIDEVESFNDSDPEIRLHLLSLAQKIIQKVSELRLKDE